MGRKLMLSNAERMQRMCVGKGLSASEENKIQPKYVNNCHKGTKKSRTLNSTMRQSSVRGARVDPVPTITRSNNILLIQIRMLRKRGHQL